MGEAAQVPTQFSEDVAAATMTGLKQRTSRGSRRTEGLLEGVVMAVLN
jgi:hypothetical protein